MTHTLTTDRFNNSTISELFERCTDFDDMSLSMDASEFAALKSKIAVLSVLANRDAQPVGFTSAAALDLISHGQAALIHRDAETTTFIEEEYRDVVPLFTYAPAVASGENCWSCGKFFTYAQHSECDGYCPHCDAPVDLDKGEEDVSSVQEELLDAMDEVIRISDRNHEAWSSAKEAIAACRAAMLAQPVSQDYKLPPHDYRELVNSLRDTAVKYSGTDQLREHLSTALSQFIEPDHHHTRTGAPDRN